MSKVSGRVLYSAIIVVFSLGSLFFTGSAQNVQNSGGQTTTLIVSKNPNGDGLRVVDQGTNRQIINTSQQGELVNASDENDDEDEELEEQVVNGLLDWLDKKKKKKQEKKKEKKEKKRKRKEKKPEPTAAPHSEPEKQEKKIIIIHINNHINKKEHHDKHKKHKGGYEHYHEGHYDNYDKHYHGKHSWPLLPHHFNWDHDFYGYSQGQGDDHQDDYSGFATQPRASYEKKPEKLADASKSDQQTKKL